MAVRLRLGSVALLVCAALSAPVAAQSIAAAFNDTPTHELVVPHFTDTELTRLLGTLDALLDAPSAKTSWAESAEPALSSFTHRLQFGQLSAAQEARVLQHLGAIGRAHPDASDTIAAERRVLSTLTVGKTAPDITGTDLDGAPLRLSDYRGKVVLVTFSAEWCGICRTQYPYERLLQELYKNWPFAILGVSNDPDAATAKQTQTSAGLAYRAWFDGEPGKSGGRIATAWGVSGWPSVYVIDGRGVIRFINLRDEDLLKGVRQLLAEQQRNANASPSHR